MLPRDEMSLDKTLSWPCLVLRYRKEYKSDIGLKIPSSRLVPSGFAFAHFFHYFHYSALILKFVIDRRSSTEDDFDFKNKL